MPGQGSLPGPPEVIFLEGTPAWVVAVPIDGGGSIWAVVLEDGRVQGFHTLRGRISPIALSPSELPPGMPPLLKLDRGVPSLVTAVSQHASKLTHPIAVDSRPARLAFVETNGDLVLWENGEIGRLALNALPDARILQDSQGRLLLLTGTTSEYGHAVLGDGLEAGAFTIVSLQPRLQIEAEIDLQPGSVVEGTGPIWTDINQDGAREILVTISDAQQGARLVVFSESGEQLATGPSTECPFRWRHQLVVAPFTADGERLIADVLTPHIGGTVEFFRWSENLLVLASSQPGLRSHRLGSRNLDMALAGDLDGNGLIELLVPNQEMNRLLAFNFVPQKPSVPWTLNLTARLTTNIGAVTLSDDRIAIGVGVETGRLLLWLPEP